MQHSAKQHLKRSQTLKNLAKKAPNPEVKKMLEDRAYQFQSLAKIARHQKRSPHPPPNK
jgi:rubrerythrin